MNIVEPTTTVKKAYVPKNISFEDAKTALGGKAQFSNFTLRWNKLSESVTFTHVITPEEFAGRTATQLQSQVEGKKDLYLFQTEILLKLPNNISEISTESGRVLISTFEPFESGSVIEIKPNLSKFFLAGETRKGSIYDLGKSDRENANCNTVFTVCKPKTVETENEKTTA